MRKQKDNRKGSKVMRYMKAPLKFLIKVRDIYVQVMIHWSDHLSPVEAAMGCPTGQCATIPRSFSINSATSADDCKELRRVASLNSHGNRAAAKKMPRSHSVGMGRIIEDEPCDFGDDVIKVMPRVYPRSRSYAIHTGTRMF